MCVCVCMCMYVYIYIYSHPQMNCFVVSQLFSVAKHNILEAVIKTQLTYIPTEDFIAQL